MIRPTYRRKLSGAIALPLLAIFTFTSAWIALPASDGSLGVSVAEAKGKGGKGKAHGKLQTEKGHTGRGHSGKGQTGKGGSDVAKGKHDRPRGQKPDAEAADEERRWGETASQLRHRNAANASESAFEHASERSNTGRIATYRDAARATLDKESDIEALDFEIENLRVRRDLAEADGRFETADELDGRILLLEDERRVADDDLYDLRVAEQDAYDAVGGPELDEHDYNIFRSMLGLD